jgi:hypothetical protein
MDISATEGAWLLERKFSAHLEAQRDTLAAHLRTMIQRYAFDQSMYTSDAQQCLDDIYGKEEQSL